MDDEAPKPPEPPSGRAKQADRRARLAAELRANLRRRKAQGRARAERGPAANEPPAADD